MRIIVIFLLLYKHIYISITNISIKRRKIYQPSFLPDFLFFCLILYSSFLYIIYKNVGLFIAISHMNGRLGLIRSNGPKYIGWWNSNSNVGCYSEKYVRLLQYTAPAVVCDRRHPLLQSFITIYYYIIKK